MVNPQYGLAELKTSNTTVKSVAGQNFVGTSYHANTQIINGFLADTLFRTVLTAVHDQEIIPSVYSLEQNYPNPFNANEAKQPGKYTLQWNASSMSSGVYFYRLQPDNFTGTKKLLLMK